MYLFSLPYQSLIYTFIRIKSQFFHHVLMALGPIQPLIPWVLGSFPGVERLGQVLNCSPPSSAESMRGAVLLFPPHAFRTWTGLF